MGEVEILSSIDLDKLISEMKTLQKKNNRFNSNQDIVKE
jgi:hypothetical protein